MKYNIMQRLTLLVNKKINKLVYHYPTVLPFG